MDVGLLTQAVAVGRPFFSAFVLEGEHREEAPPPLPEARAAASSRLPIFAREHRGARRAASSIDGSTATATSARAARLVAVIGGQGRVERHSSNAVSSLPLPSFVNYSTSTTPGALVHRPRRGWSSSPSESREAKTRAPARRLGSRDGLGYRGRVVWAFHGDGARREGCAIAGEGMPSVGAGDGGGGRSAAGRARPVRASRGVDESRRSPAPRSRGQMYDP